MELPLGTAVPINTDSETCTELYKISDVLIVQKSEYLAFVIKIPLISVEKYTMYHPIPLPISYDNTSFILLDTEFNYLALSDNDEKFFTLMRDQWEACIPLKFRMLCKGIQLIHHRAKTNLCEVMSLFKTETSLEMCHFKFITTNSPVWHRLENTNSWIFRTQPESATVTCSNPTEMFKLDVSGSGKLTTSSRCELHFDNFILLPINSVLESNLDIVNHNLFKSIFVILNETLQSIVPQKISKLNVIKDLNLLAKQSMDILNLPNKHIETSIIVKIEIHFIVIYLLILVCTITLISIFFKFRNKIAVYNPELAESQPDTGRDVTTESHV